MPIALARPAAAPPVLQPVPQPTPPNRAKRSGGALRWTMRITLGISSLLWLAGMLAIAVTTGPVGFAGSFVLAFVPVPVVLAAFRWIDRAEPEPARLLLVAFMWGATTASLMSIVFEGVLGGELWISAPIVEELAKGSILVILVLFVRSEFDGVIDGIVYAGFVAAGFAFTENIGYFAKAYVVGLAGADNAQAVPGQGHPSALIVSFVLRGLVLPFSHPLFTVMFGIGVGLAVVSAKRAVRIIAPVVGLGAAIGLHMLWDYVLLGARPGSAGLLAYFGFFAALFFGMIWIIKRLRRLELRSIEQHLAGYAHHGWFHAAELPALSTFNGRRQARRWAAYVRGPQGQRAMIDMQHAATKLGLLRRKMAAGRGVPEFATRQQALLVQLSGARTMLGLAPTHQAFPVAYHRPAAQAA
jgi:protease PrsW